MNDYWSPESFARTDFAEVGLPEIAVGRFGGRRVVDLANTPMLLLKVAPPGPVTGEFFLEDYHSHPDGVLLSLPRHTQITHVVGRNVVVYHTRENEAGLDQTVVLGWPVSSGDLGTFDVSFRWSSGLPFHRIEFGRYGTNLRVESNSLNGELADGPQEVRRLVAAPLARVDVELTAPLRYEFGEIAPAPQRTGYHERDWVIRGENNAILSVDLTDPRARYSRALVEGLLFVAVGFALGLVVDTRRRLHRNKNARTAIRPSRRSRGA